MKKIILALALCISGYASADAVLTEEQVFFQAAHEMTETLIKDIDTIPSSVLDLPFWAQMRALGITAGCTGLGNLLAFAVANTFFSRKTQQNHQTILFGTAAVGTAAGLAVGFNCAHVTEFPGGIAADLNKNLIKIALANNATTEQSLKALTTAFARSPYPRMEGFVALEKIYDQLTRIEKILEKTERRNKKYDGSALAGRIKFVISAIENAMINIKNDPLWIQECNAHSMQKAQQAMQDHNKMQLASAVIDIANAFRRN